MRLVSYEMEGDLKLGLIHDGRVADLAALAGDSDEADFFCCARCFLEAGDAAVEVARELVSAAVTSGAAATWPATIASTSERAAIS